jgi:hypothetical protein
MEIYRRTTVLWRYTGGPQYYGDILDDHSTIEIYWITTVLWRYTG